MRRFIVIALSVCGLLAATASVASARVLLVGSYHGIHGKYKTLQAAVNAAKRGDWILVGPGDYKTKTSRTRPGAGPDLTAAVLITKKGLHIRGMNRNTVIIDGTRKGAACNSKRGKPELRAQEQAGADGSQRDPRLQGQQRLDREPDRVQLPRRQRRRRQRDLVERRRQHGHDRRLGLLRRPISTRPSTFYNGEREDGGQVRHLLQRLERRHLVSGLREQLQRLRLLRRRLPAGLQPDAQPGLVGVQLAWLLGLELGRR